MRNASAPPALTMRPGILFPPTTSRSTGLIISRVMLDALQELKMAYPKTSPERRRELLAIRKQIIAQS